MIRSLSVAALGLALLAGRAQAQLQSVRGTVRDNRGTMLSGVEVLVGSRKATTNGQGAFVVDSLKPGQYPVTVRLIGYFPVRSKLAVVATEPTEVDFLLEPAPVRLQPLISESKRTGIFGAVGDSGYHAIRGARVQVSGFEGGDMLTDSTGHFNFPTAHGGQYVVRVTFPGYTERRVSVEVKKGEGVELGVLLSPDQHFAPSRIDDKAFEDLGKRLSMGLQRERLTSVQLQKYSSQALCDVPKVRSEMPRTRNETFLFVLNGTSADKMADLNRLCAWRADEVELIEFGADVCTDPTNTIAPLVGIYRCSGRTRAVTRSIAGPGTRVATQTAGMPYVIIWEKR